MSKVVILGAGIAGISAAYHAKKNGEDFNVYESSDRAGGLLGNFTINGFRFDKGAHLSFAKDSYVRSIFDQAQYYTHEPFPYNFEMGRWIKHPVQNNLFALSIQEKIEAIQGFIGRPEPSQTDDYRVWLIQQFGDYIANRFPVKYTRKYWTVNPECLSTEWLGNRFYQPSLKEVLFGAMTDETPNTHYAQELRYPHKGGFISFIEPLISECKISLNRKAISIDVYKKYVEFVNGERVYYESLINTIPLPELVKIIKDVPSHILQAAEDLWATSVALVSVGFNRPDIPKHLWFYIYDEDLLASRVHAPNLKSSDNVPPNCSSLQFEIYFSKYKPLPMNTDYLIDHVIHSLEIMKVATKEDIEITDCRILPYGNVAFEKGMTKKRDSVLEYLNDLDIYAAGRFGEWDYLWSDQCLLSGKNVLINI